MRRFLALSLLAVALLLLTGCGYTVTARDFAPRSGQVCDQIQITGDHLQFGTPTITFNGVRAPFEWNPVVTATTPAELRATIPPGATTGPLRVRIEVGWNILFITGSDRDLGTFQVTDAPAAPTINSFTGTPPEVDEGSPVTLNWNVSGHTALTLDGENVSGTTSRTVTPAATHTYRLIALNRCVSRSSEVTVGVIARPFLNPVSGTYFAGANLALTGRGLVRPSSTTTLIFTQGTMRQEVPSASAVDTRLAAAIPSTFMRGTASVQARVGTLLSNIVNFQIGGYPNGPFVEITNNIGTSTPIACGTRTLSIRATGTATAEALFTEGGRTLEVIPIQLGPLTGAAFSPGCNNAVVVTSVDRSTAQLVVQPFRTSTAPFNGFRIRTDVPERWHLLFSPDDSLLVATTGTISGASTPLTLTLGNLDNGHSVAEFAGCSAGCGSVTAAVEVSTQVRISVDGSTLLPIRIP